jgi:hypothetical protein
VSVAASAMTETIRTALRRDAALIALGANVHVAELDAAHAVSVAASDLECAWRATECLEQVLHGLGLQRVGRFAYAEHGREHLGGVYQAVTA